MAKLDINVGDRFERLTIISEVERVNRKRRFICRCDCGSEIIVFLGNIRTGKSKSCGCFSRDLTRTRLMTHNMSKTRFYKIWIGMIKRIKNPNFKDYEIYGGRGIKICERWIKFENFFKDMYETYVKHVEDFGEVKTTIDRLNSNKDYEPENCRWATQAEQRRNRRDTVKFKGEVAADASKRLGGSESLVKCRLKRGWVIEKAFTMPARSFA